MIEEVEESLWAFWGGPKSSRLETGNDAPRILLPDRLEASDAVARVLSECLSTGWC